VGLSVATRREVEGVVDEKQESEIDKISRQLNSVIATYADEFIGREKDIRMVVLSLVSKEHIYMVSPPGAGKTMMRRVAESFNFSFFYYLMNYDVKLEDVVATPKLRRVHRDGEELIDIDYELKKPGLATSEVVFLDELFKANTAMLNALLGVMNERVLTIGNKEVSVPLWTAIGASNEVPEEPSLQAFIDRFLFRDFMRYLEKEQWYAYLVKYWAMHQPSYSPVRVAVPKDVVARANRLMMSIDIYGVLDDYLKALDRLKEKGIEVSDRRKGRVLKAIAASALLSGRWCADVTDLEVLLYTIPRAEHDVGTVAKVVDEVLGSVLKVREELVSLRSQLRSIKEKLRSVALEDFRSVANLLSTAESRVIQLNTPSLSRYVESVKAEISEIRNMLPDVIAEKILEKVIEL